MSLYWIRATFDIYRGVNFMWIAENWNDFEVLDCSNGEQLERWGDYHLVRPDPQAIWSTPRKNPKWKTRDASYARSNTGGGHWTDHHLPERWQIRYKDYLTFNVKPMNFKHTGVFPEQAANWDFIRDKVASAGRPTRVLNLFAYSGGATLAAAAGGAEVFHVDASKGMVQWAKENASVSSLADGNVRWLVDDCLKFVKREIRRGNKYDVIIMDPPSYGRGPSGELWQIENELYPLLESCISLLSDKPLFFLINSINVFTARIRFFLGSRVQRLKIYFLPSGILYFALTCLISSSLIVLLG